MRHIAPSRYRSGQFCQGISLAVVGAAILGCAASSSSVALSPDPERPPLAGADWSCAPLGPEVCFDARDNNCNGLIDEGCGIGSGLIHFALAWDDASADVDLEVLDPSGDIAEVGAVSAAGLTKDRDCPGREQACRGANSENVTLTAERPLQRGEYRVQVRLDALGSDHTEVRVSLGARLGPKSLSSDFILSADDRQREFRWVL